MANTDTIELLQECNSGIKMGVNTIDEVVEKVSDADFRRTLEHCMEEHQRLGSKTHELLNKYNTDGKEPGAMAKTMSWFKTNIMTSIDDSDRVVADLITDGCNMGIKSLYRYLNKYESADSESKGIASDLISIEEHLTQDMRKYL